MADCFDGDCAAEIISQQPSERICQQPGVTRGEEPIDVVRVLVVEPTRVLYPFRDFVTLRNHERRRSGYVSDEHTGVTFDKTRHRNHSVID